ncbi:MAG: hypothetical protein ACRDZ1_17380 [Acidimicrobiia bacterium]
MVVDAELGPGAGLEDRGAPADGVGAEGTLRRPLQEAGQSFVAWAVAAVGFPLYAVLVDGLSAGHAIRVGITVFDGGLITCAVVFLLFEWALRPVFAQALASEPPREVTTVGVRPRLLLTWALGSAVPFAGLVALPLAAGNANERADIAGAVVALSLAGLFVGLLMTVVTARSVADPLETLQEAPWSPATSGPSSATSTP